MFLLHPIFLLLLLVPLFFLFFKSKLADKGMGRNFSDEMLKKLSYAQGLKSKTRTRLFCFLLLYLS